MDKIHTRKKVSTRDLQYELSGKLVGTASRIYDLGRVVIAITVVGLLVHSLLLTIQRVSGVSMLPTYVDGEAIFLDRRDWLNPARGSVVVLRYPGDPEHRLFIKRVVAVPGDSYEIKNGRVIINRQPTNEPYLTPGTVTAPEIPERTLAENEYFTLGDNRPNSNDSRFFGVVERRFIFGQVVGRVYKPKA